MKSGKVWGITQLVHSNSSFEFHRIEANAGGQCSKHKHKHKLWYRRRHKFEHRQRRKHVLELDTTGKLVKAQLQIRPKRCPKQAGPAPGWACARVASDRIGQAWQPQGTAPNYLPYLCQNPACGGMFGGQSKLVHV